MNDVLAPAPRRFKTVDAADVVKDAVPVRYDDEHDILTVDVPEGYADVKRMSKHVLRHGDRLYTFTGWNSDKNEAYFGLAHDVATVVRRRERRR